MVVCPFHNDRDPSLAIYQDEQGGHNFYCWGCKKSGDIKELEMKGINIHNITREPQNIQRYQYSFSKLRDFTYKPNKIADDIEYTDQQTKFLRDHGVQPQVAKKYGIISEGVDRLSLPIYDASGLCIGGQIRHIAGGKPKYKLLPPQHKDKYPEIAVIDQTYRLQKGNTNCLGMVESILDGLYLESVLDCPFIALMGHKLRNIGIDVLTGYPCISHIDIFFDADAQTDATAISDKLFYYYGYGVNVHAPAEGRTVYQTDYVGRYLEGD